MDLMERGRLVVIGLGTLLLVTLSVFVLNFVNESLTNKRNSELDAASRQIARSTEEIVKTGTGILYDIRGYLAADGVNSEKWESFMKANEIEERYPASYSFAYVERVPRKDLDDYLNAVRGEPGERYKNYVIFPSTDTAELYPVRYIYTADPDVSTLLGFDFSYSPLTSAAFAEAVVKDSPVLSELTRLDVVIPGSKKTGYEVVLPVYSVPDVKIYPVEERRKYLVGFVGVWIPVEKLVPEVDRGIRYSVIDGDKAVVERGSLDENNIVARKTSEFDILNRKLKLITETDRTYEIGYIEARLPFISFFGLSLILILWFLVIFSTLSARRQAVEMADVATKDLKKFKLAVDGVSDHVIITDPEGVIVYANKAAEKITGYDLEEMIGRRPSLWGGQMPKEFYKDMWHTIKDLKKPFSGEIINKRKSGELYEAEMRVSPILDKEGKLLFFVGIERDMSRLKAIEKMKAEFISLASHQLRTPLSGVKWFVEMLLSGDAGKLTALQKKHLEKIRESNEREIQLVNALLNVSRIESGRIVIISKVVDLKDLISSLVADLKVNIGGERSISEDVDKKIPNIEVDPDLIKHVYTNLITNAVQYTNPGGKIDIRVYVKDGEIVSEIKDNGIGIPETEKSRVFEKFFRASNATKKVTEGSGLGLYLTKSIVESSGGRIWFTSIEGKGSTFSFTLPIKKPAG